MTCWGGQSAPDVAPGQCKAANVACSVSLQQVSSPPSAAHFSTMLAHLLNYCAIRLPPQALLLRWLLVAGCGAWCPPPATWCAVQWWPSWLWQLTTTAWAGTWLGARYHQVRLHGLLLLGCQEGTDTLRVYYESHPSKILQVVATLCGMR